MDVNRPGSCNDVFSMLLGASTKANEDCLLRFTLWSGTCAEATGVARRLYITPPHDRTARFLVSWQVPELSRL